MTLEQNLPQPSCDASRVAVFSAHVTAHPGGGWITVVVLGDGASVSKWFPAEAEARHYPDELIAWLEGVAGN
jgi:hypothetical protein